MSIALDLEQAILAHLRHLSRDRQQQVLDFVEFLCQKTPTEPPEPAPSLTELARLPLAERHQKLAPFIAVTAADFHTDLELTEFAVLDGEDWELLDDAP